MKEAFRGGSGPPDLGSDLTVKGLWGWDIPGQGDSVGQGKAACKVGCVQGLAVGLEMEPSGHLGFSLIHGRLFGAAHPDI